jgi:hypothetical protein
MQFLGDLDGLTFLWTALCVLLAGLFLALLWVSYGNKWPSANARVLGLLLAVGVFGFVFAYNAYCPDADQPHIQRAGLITVYEPYTYTVGKGSTRSGLLVCVGPCGQGVPLMEFNQKVIASLKQRGYSIPLAVTYLGRRDDANIAHGFTIAAHPVVEIDDPATAERIFYIDTTRHWPRAIVLLFDALISLTTFGICIRTTGASAGSDEEEESSSQSDQDRSTSNELTGLGLGAEDRNA